MLISPQLISLQLVPLHGIGTRHDLPLPFSFVVVGAAAALVLSFVILFLARSSDDKPANPAKGASSSIWFSARYSAESFVMALNGCKARI